MLALRKYFEYQETKPSNKLAPAIFPEFHCVALSIINTFHPATFFQIGVYSAVYKARILEIIDVCSVNIYHIIYCIPYFLV